MKPSDVPFAPMMARTASARRPVTPAQIARARRTLWSRAIVAGLVVVASLGVATARVARHVPSPAHLRACCVHDGIDVVDLGGAAGPVGILVSPNDGAVFAVSDCDFDASLCDAVRP